MAQPPDEPGPLPPTEQPIGPHRGEPGLLQSSSSTETIPVEPGFVADALMARGYFGEYELLEEIARGGMGIVYKARHRSLGRIVALKMILSGRFASEAEAQRFRHEARSAASLEHPNIVPIYEVGERFGHAYFTMKLIDGPSLGSHEADLPKDHYVIARMLATVARAVHHAHTCGFVHRDLKPANILIDHDGRPYVSDFGLAKHVSESASLTASGAIVGTPSYMAPEQAAGAVATLTPAADVYGLGAILYTRLTGQPPFQGESAMETVVQVLETEPIPPHYLRANVPRDLELVCLKCLEKDPQRRYASAEDLAADLDRFLLGEPVNARRGGRWTRLRRWSRREPELAFRLVGLTAIVTLTQYNYMTSPVPDLAIHLPVMFMLGIWAAVSIALRFGQRISSRPDLIRLIWAISDLLILSAIILWLGAVDTSLLIGYPLLIAASGLWSRVRLIWATTGTAFLAYATVYSVSASRGMIGAEHQFPNIFLAALIVEGWVVAHQVKRLHALSHFCDQKWGTRF